MKTKKILKCKN